MLRGLDCTQQGTIQDGAGMVGGERSDGVMEGLRNCRSPNPLSIYIRRLFGFLRGFAGWNLKKDLKKFSKFSFPHSFY